jgi:hypothetical protein
MGLFHAFSTTSTGGPDQFAIVDRERRLDGRQVEDEVMRLTLGLERLRIPTESVVAYLTTELAGDRPAALRRRGRAAL